MNHKRVERIWRREGLKVPKKQPKRRAVVAERRVVRAAAADAQGPRLELRLRADRTHDGRAFRMLTRDGRVHAGVPGDRGGAEAEERGRAGALT